MRIKKVALKNYRKFKDTVLEFPAGVIGILGPNGVGKSSMMEAIAWALFGNEREIVRTKKEDIIRSGALPGDKCRVEVHFEYAENDYIVWREMKNRTYAVDAAVYENGICKARGGEKTTEYIKKLLGTDYRTFSISVYARQNDLGAFSALKPAERKERIIRLLGIDRVDRVIKKIREERNKLREKIKGAEAGLLSDEEATLLKKTIEDGKNRLEALAKKTEEITRRIKDAEAHVNSLRKRLDVLRTARKEYYELLERKKGVEEQIARLKGRMNRLVEELEDIKSAREKMEALHDYEVEYINLMEIKSQMEDARAKRVAVDRIMNEIAERRDEISRLAEERAECDKVLAEENEIKSKMERLAEEIERIRRKCEELRDVLEGIRGRILIATERWEEAKKHREEIERLGPEGVCPLCKRPLGDHYHALLKMLNNDMRNFDAEKEKEMEMEKRIAEQIETLRKQENDLTNVLRECDSRIAFIERTKAKSEELRRRIEDYRQRIESLEKELKKYGEVCFDEEEYENVCRRVEEYRKKHEEYLTLKRVVDREGIVRGEIEKIKSEIDKGKSSIQEIEKRVTKLGFNEDEYSRVEEELREAVDALHNLEIEREKVEKEKEVVGAEIEHAEKTLKKNDEILKKINEMRDELLYLEVLVGERDEGLLPSFRRYLISRIRPALMDYTSSILSSLTSGMFSDVEIDEDYGMKICEDGVYYPVDRFSGGQKDRANLSLRIAISRLLAERSGHMFNFIVLDEVFGSQDEEGRRNIMDVLQGLSTHFKQIFIITHIEDLKEYMPVVVEVFVDEQGISRARLVRH